MANPEHLEIVKQGREALNEWRLHSSIQLDLRGADLRDVDFRDVDLSCANLWNVDLNGANLRGTILREADLSRANLSRADLSRANLRSAVLRGVVLKEANLSATDLRGTDLGEADLSGTDLSDANLSDADLRSVDLSSANLRNTTLNGSILNSTIFYNTVLGGTNLTDAKGLETCDHRGPSYLDHSTIERSGGLPEVFIRGCGWPNILIDVVPALLQDPLQFYSCFISYNSQDEEFARRLHADLQANGVRCWFAPEDIRSGRKLHEQLDEAIRIYDKLLLVLSKHSMASNWVEFEIRRARKRELHDQRRVLFPLSLVDFDHLQKWERFNADEGRDLAVEIREYYIPDFTHWKDYDAYQQALTRLLRDLRPEDI